MERVYITECINKWRATSNRTIQYTRQFDTSDCQKIQSFNDVADRWGAFYEENRLYIFRTWTLSCIYTVLFSEAGRTLAATVCDDKKIYDGFGDEIEAKEIDWLIDDLILFPPSSVSLYFA